MFDPTHTSLQLVRDRPLSLDGRCILVVDDHPSIKFTTATALGDAGGKVQFASGLEEAVFRWITMSSAARPFDLIIVCLEERRGASICRRLRESGYHGPMLGIGGLETAPLDSPIDIDARLDFPVDPQWLQQVAADLVASHSFSPLDHDDLPPSA